jgi:hypothetical protein
VAIRAIEAGEEVTVDYVAEQVPGLRLECNCRAPNCRGLLVVPAVVKDGFITESPERLHRSFQDAFNRHDLESIVALYEPEAVLLTSSGPVRGTDAVRQAYRDILVIRPRIERRQVWQRHRLKIPTAPNQKFPSSRSTSQTR